MRCSLSGRVVIQYRRCSDIWKIPLTVQDNTELCTGTLKTCEGILCMAHSLQTKMGSSLDTLWSYFSTQCEGMTEVTGIEQIERGYERFAERLNQQDWMLTAGMGRALSEQADSVIFRRVLDVGCGTGG